MADRVGDVWRGTADELETVRRHLQEANNFLPRSPNSAVIPLPPEYDKIRELIGEAKRLSERCVLADRVARAEVVLEAAQKAMRDSECDGKG